MWRERVAAEASRVGAQYLDRVRSAPRRVVGGWFRQRPARHRPHVVGAIVELAERAGHIQDAAAVPALPEGVLEVMHGWAAHFGLNVVPRTGFLGCRGSTSPAVEGCFNLVQRTVGLNRRLAVRWAEATGTLSGVVREKARAAGGVVRERPRRPVTSRANRLSKPRRPRVSRPKGPIRPRRSWHARLAGPSASAPGGLTRGPVSATKF